MDQRLLDNRLLESAREGDVSACRALLTLGANPVGPAGYCNEMALHIAVANSRLDVCRLFLEQGASANKKMTAEGDTPLAFACRQEDAEIVRLLVEHGADVSDARILNSAISCGNVEMCRILIGAGADICAVDAGGWGRLHALRDVGEVSSIIEMWPMLISAPDLIDKPNDFGATPLYWAAEKGNVTLCRLLLESGADANFVSTNKAHRRRSYSLFGDITPYQIAARKGHLRVIELFLNAGVDPHWSPVSRRSDYQTPFQIAVVEGNTGMVAAIHAASDIDFGQRTANGRPLMGLAHKHPEMKILLRALRTEATISREIAEGATLPAQAGSSEPTPSRGFGPL